MKIALVTAIVLASVANARAFSMSGPPLIAPLPPAAPFRLIPGGNWPSGTDPITTYAERFAVKVELLLAIGGDFYGACQTAKVTAAIGIEKPDWNGALDKLTNSWLYGQMCYAWQQGWEGR